MSFIKNFTYDRGKLTTGIQLNSQLGQDIDGKALGDQSGYSVSINSAGDRVAIGAILNDGGGSDRGHTRIYQWNGSSWTQLGNDIDGETDYDQSGYSVSMNSDGNRVAIGAIYNDGGGSDRGHTRIYQWNGSSWTKLGNDIDGEADSDQSGWSVSINSAGNRVAIGARYNDGNGTRNGHVRIFEYNSGSNSWEQLGFDINGERAWDQSGCSVSINSAGNRVAIGAVGNDDNGNKSGHVRIYEWRQYTNSDSGLYNYSSVVQNDTQTRPLIITENFTTPVANYYYWTQLGSDINGEDPLDESGYSVSINANGNRVAIGAYLNDDGGIDSGHTRIYEWDGSSWTQLGQDIDGEAAGDESGYSVSMNSAGDRVAIGARYNDGNGTRNGHVRIYQWNGSSWEQLGFDINGERSWDYSGWSVSINSAGDRVAIGAKGNDGNGGDSGHTRIYQIATYIAQTYAPVYGSSITFTSNNSSWNAGNYNTFVMPNGINNLKAEMNLKFQGGRDRIGPLLLRIENMTTGNIIGNEGLKEIEYKPSFDGSLNDVYVLTGSNEISIPDRDNHGVYIPSNANESIQAYLDTGSNGLTRDIVFPFVINADNKTKYKIQFNYKFSGDAGLKYRLYLNDNPLRVNFQNIDLNYSTDNQSFEHESTFETVGSIKTGYLKLRAVSGTAGAEEFSISSASYINLSNMSMKETYYDTVLNFGDAVNNAIINLDNDYYNNFSGSLIEDYSLNVLAKDVYEVNVKAINNSNSSLLQNGMAFVNKSNVYAWNSSPREEFDVISGAANSNVFDNYFYVNGDYSGSDSNFLSNISGLYSYTGSYNGATRTFFWEPDQENSISVSHSNRMNNFKRSFTDQLNIGRNQNKISQLNLTFSNRGQKETYSMLHFFETHLGYKPFVYYYGDEVINKNRVFYCPTWTHTFNYKDSNTITATFVEIPNPTIPKF